MIKSLFKKISEILSGIIPQQKLTEGTISYDFWSTPNENLEKKLKETSDTRDEKLPFVKFYFNQKISRKIYEDEEPKDSFGWFEIDNLKTKTIRIKNGEVDESESSMNYRINPDWNVKYEIKRIPDDKKEIAGFMCVKYEILEIKQIKEKITKRQFKIYATKEIKLPGHVICDWYDQVIPECPLEIISSFEHKASSTFLKVREVSKELPNSAFEIPKRFKK